MTVSLPRQPPACCAFCAHAYARCDWKCAARACAWLTVPSPPAAELHAPGSALVFLNGHILGCHHHPQRFSSSVRALRRSGRIGEFVSVHTVENRCYIASDGGRVCRPLIIVDDGAPRVMDFHLQELKDGLRTWTDFIRDGLIEFLDVNEENDSAIALCAPHRARVASLSR